MMGKKRTPAELKAAKDKRQKRKREAEREAAEQLLRDREGNARPTPERVIKGVFDLRDTDDAGIRCAVDTASTRLDRMRIAGTITPEQCQGGLDFAALMDRTRLTSPGRSCINFDPVGYDDSDVPDPQAVRDDRERAELYQAVSPWTWAEMRRVCCEDRKPADMDRLKTGLDVCVAFWGK